LDVPLASAFSAIILSPEVGSSRQVGLASIR
jgi:hypothetical protein